MTELMVIVPHPDDEVFGAGGLLAKMAEAGRSTSTLHLTRGRGGRSLGLCTPEQLGTLRERELRDALAILGVTDSTVWDEHDYVPDDARGIARHAGLASLDETELAERIAEQLDRVAPRAVVTFGPNGSNGHPDHVATHRAVMAAVELVERSDLSVYAYASDARFEAPERDGFLDPEEVRRSALLPTHVVDVRPWLETKLRAMACHRSQALSVLDFVRRFPRRLGTETFHRLRPAPDPEVTTVTASWL